MEYAVRKWKEESSIVGAATATRMVTESVVSID